MYRLHVIPPHSAQACRGLNIEEVTPLTTKLTLPFITHCWNYQDPDHHVPETQIQCFILLLFQKLIANSQHSAM